MINTRVCSAVAIGALTFALFSTPVRGVSFSVIPGGDLTATVADFGGGSVFYDFQGTNFVQVFNPGSIGAVVLAGGHAPFGNRSLAFVNGAFTEFIGLSLNDSTLQLVGPTLTIDGTLTPGTPITDPPLAAVNAFSLVRLGFQFVSADTTVFPGATVGYYALSSLREAPEPGSLALFAGGGFVLMLLRKRQ